MINSASSCAIVTVDKEKRAAKDGHWVVQHVGDKVGEFTTMVRPGHEAPEWRYVQEQWAARRHGMTVREYRKWRARG